MRVDYTLAAARAFADMAKREGKKFCFVFLSGMIVVRDQKSSLWLYSKARKMAVSFFCMFLDIFRWTWADPQQGQAEIELLQLAKERPHELEAYIMRPAFVLGKERTMGNALGGLLPSVRVDELAAVLLDVAENGAERKTWENADLWGGKRELM